MNGSYCYLRKSQNTTGQFRPLITQLRIAQLQNKKLGFETPLISKTYSKENLSFKTLARIRHKLSIVKNRKLWENGFRFHFFISSKIALLL